MELCALFDDRPESIVTDVVATGDAEPVQEGLESAASFLRRGLARALPLKRVPALDFRYDPSIVRGAETLALLRELDEDGVPEDG